MSQRPWMKFYPADWQADELLGMCTLAARGLWVEMIGIMHKAVPYGHLLVNGRNPTDVQLAALARCPPDQVPGLLDELENAGVFSRARNRTIYSRRMTRDEKRRKDGQTGKITGQKVPNSRRSQLIEKAGDKIATLKVAGKVDDQPPSNPEARDQNPEKEDSGAIAPGDADPVKLLWDRGLMIVGKHNRSLLGKLCKQHGNVAVMEAIVCTEQETRADPLSFLLGCLKNAKQEMNGHAKLTPANQRFLAGREATLRAVLERERAAEAGDG